MPVRKKQTKDVNIKDLIIVDYISTKETEYGTNVFFKVLNTELFKDAVKNIKSDYRKPFFLTEDGDYILKIKDKHLKNFNSECSVIHLDVELLYYNMEIDDEANIEGLYAKAKQHEDEQAN